MVCILVKGGCTRRAMSYRASVYVKTKACNKQGKCRGPGRAIQRLFWSWKHNHVPCRWFGKGGSVLGGAETKGPVTVKGGNEARTYKQELGVKMLR